ncbi:Rieske 2Fe-2S domain-containing protein [Haloterrigena salinisoli]|uniref:Rieske (2Fe-2S) protein n=1 Tax=Haloterrigena salinisoli TaxID=3132747 RepID=UPI0030CC0F12
MSGKQKHFVTTADDLNDGEHVIVDIREREIAVFNLDGDYYGLLNYCTHQGGPACEGRLTGELVEDDDGELRYERDGEFVCCPWHGWEFDIKSGYNLARSDEYRVPTYEVVEEGGDLYVIL